MAEDNRCSECGCSADHFTDGCMCSGAPREDCGCADHTLRRIAAGELVVTLVHPPQSQVKPISVAAAEHLLAVEAERDHYRALLEELAAPTTAGAHGGDIHTDQCVGCRAHQALHPTDQEREL